MRSVTRRNCERRLAAVVWLVSAAVCVGHVDAGEPASPRIIVAPERPDDPYVPSVGPAKTSAPFVPRGGGFAGVQVNASRFGNIVGDASNEPSIVVDPNNPMRMAVGWRHFTTIASNFRQAGVAYTQDGGLSWTFPGVLDPGQFRSDPVLVPDADGNFYYNSLSTLETVEVFRSVDGGVTWGPPIPSFGGDKTWMAIDRTGGVGHGTIYAKWQTFFGCCGDRTFTRSIDGGDSYEEPIAVPLGPSFGTMDVGPDGELYITGILAVTGQDFNTIVVVKSSDAQNTAVVPTFELATVVDLGGAMGFGGAPNPAGLLGQAQVATDHSDGPTRGNVYLLMSANPPGNDPLDVMFSRSEDGGQTWSAPVRVNDDPVGNDAWQWFGTMSVAPNGRIDVIWNDTRTSGVGTLSELYYSYSEDAGVSWTPNVAISPMFDSTVGWPQQNKLGDYYHSVSEDRFLNIIYAATFNGEQDVYFLRIPHDCNDNGTLDGDDIANGDSLDANANGIPDECDFGPLLAADAPDDVPKSRYLTFRPNSIGIPMAIQIALPDGRTGWIGEPENIDWDGVDAASVSLVVDSPVMRVWDEALIHVTGCVIAPDRVYVLRTSDLVGVSGLSLDVMTVPAPDVSGSFADIVGTFEDGAWTAPNGAVNFADINAAIKKFQASPTAAHVTVVDLHPQWPNYVINFEDISQVVKGFQGVPYPVPVSDCQTIANCPLGEADACLPAR